MSEDCISFSLPNSHFLLIKRTFLAQVQSCELLDLSKAGNSLYRPCLCSWSCLGRPRKEGPLSLSRRRKPQGRKPAGGGGGCRGARKPSVLGGQRGSQMEEGLSAEETSYSSPLSFLFPLPPRSRLSLMLKPHGGGRGAGLLQALSYFANSLPTPCTPHWLPSGPGAPETAPPAVWMDTVMLRRAK